MSRCQPLNPESIRLDASDQAYRSFADRMLNIAEAPTTTDTVVKLKCFEELVKCAAAIDKIKRMRRDLETLG